MNDAGLIAAPIPLERELDERLSFFIRLRWLAATGILVGGWIYTGWTGAAGSAWPLSLTGAGVLAYNAVFALQHRRRRGQQPVDRSWVYAQMALDWVALTSLVYYTGGVKSPVALAFAFHIMIGAFLLPRAAAWVQAGIASALLGMLMAAEGDAASLMRWAMLSAFFTITAFLVRSIAGALRRKERALVESQAHLDLAFHEMEALYELGQVAYATLDLDQVLALIAERATSLTGCKGCSIGLLDDSGEAVLPVASHGLSEDYLSKGPVQVERSAMVAQALAGEVVQVDDIAADARLQYPEGARREGIRSIVCVALKIGERPIGVLRVYAATPRPFSEGEISFLLNLANLAAVAIHSARAYAESQALSDERAWFARTTHHQLRAPLAVMRALLEALAFAGELTDKQTELVERATRRVDGLLELVRDLLELAHAQRLMPHLKPEPVALARSLAKSLETLTERAQLKGVNLVVKSGDDIVAAADEGDVERILANLLENAVKYTPSGGQVTLTVERRGESVCIQVRDTGIGIAEADREQVFRGFFRTEAAKETGEYGTGVGLSIVERLVRRWHGTLELQSAVGEGSCFTVHLPAAIADEDESDGDR